MNEKITIKEKQIYLLLVGWQPTYAFRATKIGTPKVRIIVGWYPPEYPIDRHTFLDIEMFSMTTDKAYDIALGLNDN